MDILDFINELRTGRPDVKKAEKGMRVLGWICLFGAVWNFALFYLMPFNQPPFNLPPIFPYIALISLSSTGFMFLSAAKGIREKEKRGVRLGQTAIAIMLALMLSTLFLIPDPFKEIFKHANAFSYLFAVFFFIAIAQFVVPAYFGIRYLGKLPINNNDIIKQPMSFEGLAKPKRTMNREETYHHSPFPFGLHITFTLLVVGTLLISFATERFFGLEAMAAVFGPLLFITLFGPVVYNYVPSPFQKTRTIIASFTGGGSISLLNASWPFFRLLVYEDGLEVRVEFQRYFIPYDNMEDLPEKLGFFSRGLLIKSDLPGVPSSIRFGGFGMKRVLAMVNERRKIFILEIG